MPVLQIRCPHCRSEFVDSRSEWTETDVARCPTCGASFAAHAIEVEPATDERGRVVHAEPTVAMPLDRRAEVPPGAARRSNR